MKKLSGLFLGDRVIWIVFFALCIISVVEVFSALSTLTYQSGSYILPIARHAAFLITGFVVVQIVHRMPCRYFRAMLPFAVLASVLLLVLLQLGFGITLNGGTRWFNFFGIPLQKVLSHLLKSPDRFPLYNTAGKTFSPVGPLRNGR